MGQELTTTKPEIDTSLITLLQMLSVKRPHRSRSERKFIRKYIAPLGAVKDASGNYTLRIGDAPVLWSCHTDTVHTSGGTQPICPTGKTTVGLAKNAKSNCLGADDTAGVWLMTEMIKAKVPGLYVFHRGEERGCIGSRWIAKYNPELLKPIKFAIALDRKGKKDVITWQMGRCCSDEFAKSLAEQLGMGYKPSPNGMFTDTAQYTDLIGECTNLSVGYEGQHTKHEELDVGHLKALRDKLLTLDVSKLVSKRKPGEKSRYYDGDYGSYDWSSDGWWSNEPKGTRTYPRYYGQPYGQEVHDEVGPLTMDQLVRYHPDIVRDMLEEWGFDAKSLREEVTTRLGYLRTWEPQTYGLTRKR